MSVILAFDLETVLDVDAGRRIWGFEGTDDEVAKSMTARQIEKTDGRSDFLPPAFHRIVALGLAGVTLGPEPKIKAQGFVESELSMLRRFMGALENRPQLVSYNGNGFDLPALRWRSLLWGVSTALLDGPSSQKPWEQYLNRYSEAHVDLADVLAGHGASPRIQLDEATRLVGLPGKTVSHGSEVAGLVAAGDWPTIERYVRSDATQTLMLFLRWQLGRGRIARETYTAAAESLEADLMTTTAKET